MKKPQSGRRHGSDIQQTGFGLWTKIAVKWYRPDNRYPPNVRRPDDGFCSWNSIVQEREIQNTVKNNIFFFCRRGERGIIPLCYSPECNKIAIFFLWKWYFHLFQHNIHFLNYQEYCCLERVDDFYSYQLKKIRKNPT